MPNWEYMYTDRYYTITHTDRQKKLNIVISTHFGTKHILLYIFLHSYSVINGSQL